MKRWVTIGIVVTMSIVSCGILMFMDTVGGGHSFTVADSVKVIATGAILYILVLFGNKFTV